MLTSVQHRLTSYRGRKNISSKKMKRNVFYPGTHVGFTSKLRRGKKYDIFTPFGTFAPAQRQVERVGGQRRALTIQ